MPKLKSLQIFADGASRGNPGPAAIAFIIEDSKGNVLERCSKRIGITTNNVAEYTALIKALEHGLTYGREKLICFCDSRLVVNQLNGIYRVKSKRLKRLFLELEVFKKEYKHVIFSYLPRTHPKIAEVDKLVNKELNKFEKLNETEVRKCGMRN